MREADAGRVSSFRDVLPANVLLLCGIFGNISIADIEHTIRAAPALCTPDAVVIWTRHRRAPDQTGHLRTVFEHNGFSEIAFEALATDTFTGVGVNRLSRPFTGAPSADPLFTFTR